jgi:circadian clock protein KaiC
MIKKGRISTGVYGLDDLMCRGFRENTINIVRGGTGVGKTTFAMQFSLYGLNRGEKVIYISFEMSKEQIIRDSIDIGWTEVEHHIQEGNLKIIHIFGEDLTFPSLDLAEIIGKSISSENPRIVIDPLTYPTFYSEKEKRKSLSTIFQELRKLGTSLIVLEEPNDPNHIPDGSLMPLYLADTVIYLQNLGFGEMFDRTLRIMKHRGSKHGDSLYPYFIETGLGIVVRPSEQQIERVKPKLEFDKQFTEAIKKSRKMGAVGKTLSARFETLRKNWTRKEDPSEILRLVLKEEDKRHGKNT